MKFDSKFCLDFIKERKKEIFVVVIYFIVFGLLMSIFNDKKIEKADREFDVNLAETQYNRVKNITLTEAELKSEVIKKIKEYEELDKKLPVNLKNQDVNQKLAKIINETGNIFSLANCKVSELKMSNDSLYNAYQVKVNSVNCTYYQLKNFLKYINENESKVTVTQLDLSRNVETIKGTMTLVFYGEIRNEGEV